MKSQRDSGYFPEGQSVLRRVHGERIVGSLYGLPALLMQAADPVAFTGLMGKTQGLDAPFKRLARTAGAMETVFFGTRAEADDVTARVRKMHAHVKGTIDSDAGKFPAGTRFSAEEPALLLWILSCLAYSAMAVYEAFVARLSDEEHELFWQDYLIVGELFGLPRQHAPATYDEFMHYMHERLSSDELFVTDRARSLGLRIVFLMPVPLPLAPALPAVDLITAALLPEQIRRFYGIPWTAALDTAFRSAALAARLGSRFMPSWLSRGSNTAQFRLVAGTEAIRKKLNIQIGSSTRS